MAVLLEPILSQILQAEMIDRRGAKPEEHTDDRRGYRNGTYDRKLTTRVGTLELEMPCAREGTLQTELFERYQRSEKALVESDADGGPGSIHPTGEEHHCGAVWPRVLKLHGVPGCQRSSTSKSRLGPSARWSRSIHSWC